MEYTDDSSIDLPVKEEKEITNETIPNFPVVTPTNNSNTTTNIYHNEINGKDYTKECRICGDNVEKEDPDVYAPCECAIFIHNRCYNDWLKFKNNLDNCDVCLKPFKKKIVFHPSKTKIIAKLLVIFIVLFYSLAYWGPYLGNVQYDKLYPTGIQVCNNDTIYGYALESDNSTDSSNTTDIMIAPDLTNSTNLTSTTGTTGTTGTTNGTTGWTLPACWPNCYTTGDHPNWNYNYISAGHHCFDYIPLDDCKCATLSSNNNNTICYNFTGEQRCSDPSTQEIQFANINWSLFWFIDLVNDAIVYWGIMVMTYLILTKYFKDDSIDNDKYFSAVLIIYGCIFAGGVFMIVIKAIVLPSPNVDKFYLLVLMNKIVNYLFHLGAVSFFLYATIYQKLNRIYSISIAIVFMLIIEIFFHCFGIFVTQVIFMSSDKFTYSGWKYPNVYNFDIGMASSIIMTIGIIFLILLLLLIGGCLFLTVTCFAPENVKSCCMDLKIMCLDCFFEKEVKLENTV
jgi:hypothetical protein